MNNIEKSAFHRGQWVGYGFNTVWRIIKNNIGYVASDQNQKRQHIYAKTLREMSQKLNGEMETFKNNPAPLKHDEKWWRDECNYISRVCDKNGEVKEMNYDPAVFKRYCEMQRDVAERDKFFDVVQYIQHCIDDIKLKNPSAKRNPDIHVDINSHNQREAKGYMKNPGAKISKQYKKYVITVYKPGKGWKQTNVFKHKDAAIEYAHVLKNSYSKVRVSEIN